MERYQINQVLGYAQRYVNAIDLGTIYNVAVLTKTKCYTYQVRNGQARLKKSDIDTFAKELAIGCLEEFNNDYYFEVKNAFQDLGKEEAMIVVYSSTCGDLDHFYRGTVQELRKQVYEDFDIQEGK